MSTFTFEISEKDVEQYAEISGDYNPIHLDADAAIKHGFEGKVAHGMLTIAKVLSVITKEIFTESMFIREYEFTFVSPVYVGGEVTLNVIGEGQELRVVGKCAGEIVIKGTIGVGNHAD